MKSGPDGTLYYVNRGVRANGLAGGSAEDNQSTMGAYVGKTKNDNGKGTMVDYVYFDGAKFQPSNDEVKKLRPQ